jgi:hypothetical protein
VDAIVAATALGASPAVILTGGPDDDSGMQADRCRRFHTAAVSNSATPEVHTIAARPAKGSAHHVKQCYPMTLRRTPWA